MIRSILLAASLLAAAGTAAQAETAQGAGTVSHADLLASVKTVKPVEGFNHVIGGTRYVGYFLARDGGCAVTVTTAGADDERLVIAPTRVEIAIPAADRTEIPAEGGRALGIACTVDADAIKLVTLEPRPMVSAGN